MVHLLYYAKESTDTLGFESNVRECACWEIFIFTAIPLKLTDATALSVLL